MESKPKSSYGQCRCCLSQGYHKDINKDYNRNGGKENYSNIIFDCFNLYLSTTSGISQLICSSCISKLQAAAEFKTLIMQSEQYLLLALGSTETVFINVPVIDNSLNTTMDIKTETIKMEPADIDEGVERVYQNENQVDYDQGDGDKEEFSEGFQPSANEEEPLTMDDLLSRYLPSELTRLPTKESLYDICPAYVRYLDLLKDKVITAEMIERLLDDPQYFHKKFNIKSPRTISFCEKYAIIANISTLIANSNMAPFKSKNRSGIPCYYCRKTFDTSEKLREHQNLIHKRSEFKRILRSYGAESIVVNVDITDLKCTICDENTPNISELKIHLIKRHGMKFYSECTDRIVPYKLSENDVFMCQICGFNFETFGSIERHMNVHFRNYVCNICGSGFISKYRLKVHVKSMHIEGNHSCLSCNKTFASHVKLKNHVDTVHKMLKRFKCPKCSVRFTEYFQRQKHLVAVHNVAPLKYRCNVCEKTFDRRYALSRHMKRDHLEEREFQCEHCPYRSFSSTELRIHMVKHVGERIFECGVCKKSYARKKTLREHMRIHNNDRRFVCPVCGQAFVQKCSLKGHIKTHHHDYNLPI